MQFKLTKPRPSPPHSLLSCLACAAATAASTLPSVSGFACRCQALKLNTFLWLIRSVERGKQKSFCYFCCYCCVKRFSVAYFCAPGRSSCGFSRILLSHPPSPLSSPCDCIIFREYSLGFILHDLLWFCNLPPPIFSLPHSACSSLPMSHTHLRACLSACRCLRACLCACVCVCKCTLAVLPAFVVLSHTWPINQTCVNVFTLYAHSYISNIFAAFYA